MKQFFLSLKNQLLIPKDGDGKSTIKTIRKWNNQLALLYDEKGAKTNLFKFPAVFPAFVTSEIMQLGEGRQLYDPLIFELHILHWQLDGGAGTFEDDVRVFDLKDIVFKAIQKFQPGLTDENNPAGSCIRIAEFEDNNHRGVYHFVQRYKTTFVEQLMAEPVGGSDWTTPMPLQLNILTQEKQDAAVAYDPSVQYLAVNQTIVRTSDGNVYIIKLDTPNPAGTFDASKWTLLEPIINNFTP